MMDDQSATLTAQQAALLELRARYERGAITYDVFRAAFQDILKAPTASACQQILVDLPVLAITPLDSLDRPPTPIRPAGRGTHWLVMVLGELAKTRRPWRMGRRTIGVMGLGEMTLDLSLAEIPRRGTLRIVGGLGEVTIRVPRGLPVEVQAMTLLGESNALGETSSGFFTHLHEEEGTSASGSDRLIISVFLAIGQVNVEYTARQITSRDASSTTVIPQAVSEPKTLAAGE